MNGTPESGVYGRWFTDKIMNGTPESGVYGRWFTDKIMNGTPESGVYGRWFTDKVVNGIPESGVYGRWFTDKVVNGTPESGVYGRHVNKDIQINFTLRYDTESVHIEEKKMKINNQEESWVLNTPENAQVFCNETCLDLSNTFGSIIVDCLREKNLQAKSTMCLTVRTSKLITNQRQ